MNEHDIRLFFDAADRLLMAAQQNGLQADRATAALTKVTAEHERQIKELRADVIEVIDRSADITAKESARLLSEHFHQADRAAEGAAARYERAAKLFSWRNFVFIITGQLVIFLIMAALIITLVPSLDEIRARQAELAQLREESGHFPGSWHACRVGNEVRRCFRTDESAGLAKLSDGSTWRLPWTKP